MSIQKQTHTNWSIVFFDNYSSDNTVALIKEFALRDPRILIEEFQSTVPINTNFNRAIEISISKYVSDFVGFIGGDDMLLEETFLEKLVGALTQNYSIAIPKHKIQEAIETDSYYSTYNHLSSIPLVNRILQAWDSNFGNIFYSLFLWKDFLTIISDDRAKLTSNLTTDWWFINTALRVTSYPPKFISDVTYIKFNKRYGYGSEYYHAGVEDVKGIGVQSAIDSSMKSQNFAKRVLIWTENIIIVPTLILFRERLRIRWWNYPEFLVIWTLMVTSRFVTACKSNLRKL